MTYPISICIPTFKEPEYLDITIQSAIDGQVNNNEYIIVIDGTYKENEWVLNKWKDKIKPIIFNENYGQSKCTNWGVYNASFDNVFICNDDQVFPKDWDKNLLNGYDSDTDVMTANQIEPYPSIFKQFICYDFGKTISEFNIEKFYKLEPLMRKNEINEFGSTLPYLISKLNFLKTGGWSEEFPSGQVVDWECMLKYQLCGLKMKRNYMCNLYHFVSIGTSLPDKIKEKQIKEQQGFEYFKMKWGVYPRHDHFTNKKTLS